MADINTEIKNYVDSVLNNTALTDTQKADQINQRAAEVGVTREQIANATGYNLNTVNAVLGANSSTYSGPAGTSTRTSDGQYSFYGPYGPDAASAAPSPAPAPAPGAFDEAAYYRGEIAGSDGTFYTSSKGVGAPPVTGSPAPNVSTGSPTTPSVDDGLIKTAQTAAGTVATPTPTPSAPSDYTPAYTPPPQQQKQAEQLRVTPEMTVQGQLRNILDPNNPLMQQAATTGMQQAASRGLINSTIGQTAAQDSMYRTALPIAQQDASTNSNVGLANMAAVNQFARDYNLNLNDIQKMAIAQTYNLQNMDVQQRNALALNAQQYGFNSALSAQGYGQQRGLNEQQYGFNSALSNQGYNQQLGLNQQNFGFNSALSNQNYNQTLGINAANVANQNAINNNSTNNQIKLQDNQTGNTIKINDASTGNQQVLNQQTANLNTEQQNNATANARSVAFTSGVNSLMSTLSQQIANINANASITDPEAKKTLIQWQKNTTAAAVRTLASASGDIDATSFINNIMSIDSSPTTQTSVTTTPSSAPQGKPTPQVIAQEVGQVLAAKDIPPIDKATLVRQAMARNGLSVIDVAAATGYTKSQVEQFLALAP